MAGVSLSQEVGEGLEEVVGIGQGCCKGWTKAFKKAAYLQGRAAYLQGHDTGLTSSHPVYQLQLYRENYQKFPPPRLGGRKDFSSDTI